MRTDFHKVIITRPRRSSSDGYRNLFRRKRSLRPTSADLMRDPDAWSRREPIRRFVSGGGTKEFSDFLSPLYRFIESRVGSRWDDVRSEIVAAIPRGLHGEHVRLHLRFFVHEHAALDGDVLRTHTGEEITWGVGVVDGILVLPPGRKKRKRRRRSPLGDDYVRLDERSALVRIDGTWFVCRFPPLSRAYWIDARRPNDPRNFNAKLATLRPFCGAGRPVKRGDCVWYGKRQLAKRELRDLGLRSRRA